MVCLVFSLEATFLEDGKKALANNNPKEAIEFFLLAAREGEDEANFQLGKIYYLSKYQKRDLDKAFEYFVKAADYGHLKARYNTAIIYSQKKFAQHSYLKAYEIFLELAKQSQANGQYKVGMFLIYGLGVDKDYTLAKKWLEESFFENKYQRASCGLAYLYANGLGVIQNLGRARKLSENLKDTHGLCKKVFTEFRLEQSKYNKDLGFKIGYYKD